MNLDFLKTMNIKYGGHFIMLVGPPGSGKSTLAKQLSDEYGFDIISPDDIREELTGDASIQTQNRRVFDVVYSRFKDKLLSGYNVVYDATNCRPIYRHKIIEAVKPYCSKIICIVADTSLVDCTMRNAERDHCQVPEKVIEKMYMNLHNHPPTPFEGYDLILRF